MNNETLAVCAKTGARWAASELVERNAPYVLGVAKKMARRCRSLQVEDLLSVGQSGLLRAVEKYDPDTGNKFLTYASWWVRQAIQLEIENADQVVRVPVHVHQHLRSIHFGKFTGSESARERYQSAGRLRSTVSLDAPVRDDETKSLGDVVVDDASVPADEALSRAQVAEVVRSLVAHMNLDVRERALVERRLMGDASLDDLGEEFGLSRERMRQIEVPLRQRLRVILREVGW